MAIKELTCKNCGALIHIEEDCESVSCPYCDTEIDLKEGYEPAEEHEEKSEALATLSEDPPHEEEDHENNDIDKEIEELTAASRKDFRIGMTIMVSSLLITTVCALTGTALNHFYHSNPIERPLDSIVKLCSYAFYFGLFFIIRSYIKRNKIPK